MSSAEGFDARTVAVLGLGLIGGSLARDLAVRGIRVIARDQDQQALRNACEAGVVGAGVDEDLRQLAEADVVVLATPVDEAHGLLRRLAAMELGARLVMDVGSTKSDALATAIAYGLGARFVGSHPLAGDHQSGWGASREGLFVGARVFLCPAPQAMDDPLTIATALWQSLGAIPECIDAREHDERLAWSSHMPHVVSSTVAIALRRAGIRRSDLGPGGRDVTRLAGSSPDVWIPIVRENASAIAAALALVEADLCAVRQMLIASDSADLSAQFSEARAWFRESGENAIGASVPTDDSPGRAGHL